jgi:hypothetical protein
MPSLNASIALSMETSSASFRSFVKHPMYAHIDSFDFCWQWRNSSIPMGLLYVAQKFLMKALTSSSQDLMIPSADLSTKRVLNLSGRVAGITLPLLGFLCVRSRFADNRLSKTSTLADHHTWQHQME